MSGRKDHPEGPERGEGTERDERPRVKVVDRRRVRAEQAPAREEASASPSEGAPDASPEAAGGEDLAAQLESARREAAEYRDHLQRLQAEFENYRKRVLKEQTRAVEMAAEPLVRRLLEVLDEFDLALMAAERSPDFERFLHGVELVYAKLLDSLKAEGLERIEAMGKPFDPTEHEALMQTGEGEGEPVVADVLRQGYKLRGHVIRPAGVRVTRQ
ncbi:MAG TPA: nucleotide exchange factor GrpE [Actinomycetota bacterium]|nr:nucleotide exchange factor GrpE [Actinomycetota bacterium]